MRWLSSQGAAGTGVACHNGQNNANGADFKPLMDLIQNTVATKSWIDNGGNGTISEFPTGVWVDPDGVLRPLMKEARSGDLAALRTAQLNKAGGQDDVHSEFAVANDLPQPPGEADPTHAALGQNPDEAMKYLAGLRRIEYVFAYPEPVTWLSPGRPEIGPSARRTASSPAETGDPVVRLDDLVVVFRHMMKGSDAYFGCKIDPRQDRPERRPKTSPPSGAGRKLAAGDAARKAYCEQLAAAVGKQDIDVFGGLTRKRGPPGRLSRPTTA